MNNHQGDFISRSAAIEEINKWLEQTGAIPLNTSYHFELLGCIEDCPSVPPQVAHGRWIRADDWTDECSECGHAEEKDIEDRSNYCPNCGAKMAEE